MYLANERVAIATGGKKGVGCRGTSMKVVVFQFSSSQGLVPIELMLDLRVRVQIIRHARTDFVCKYQSCMFSNVGLSIHAPVGC